MLPNIQLQVQVRKEGDALKVAYKISHQRPQPIYIIDGAFLPAKEGAVVWSDRLRVGFRPPDVAVLSSALVPLNPLTTPAFPPQAYAVKVEAGKPYENTLSAPLPLIPDVLATVPPPVTVGKKIPPPTPEGFPGVPDHPVTCKRLVFELGVIPHDDALQPFAMELAGRPVVRLPGLAWRLQQLATVEQPFEAAMLVVKGMEKPDAK